MRLLIDEHVMPWEEAWLITTRTFAYTNHTLLPEALECWQLDLFRRVLPRHLEIIYEINARFLDAVRIRFLGDEERLARMSLIDERGERYVRMAHLACVGSHAINGVAAMHSELVRTDLLADFHALWPEKFQNKTNGVTPRRWMVLGNPRLAKLITSSIGEGWITDLYELQKLEPMVDDAGLLQPVACHQAAEQAGPVAAGAGVHRRRHRSAVAVRRAGQAHPRVQAPAPQHPARHRAVPAPQGVTRTCSSSRAPSSSAARRRPAITWPS